MRACPDFFGTGTIRVHHSVGSVTASMMFLVSILANSSFTAPAEGDGRSACTADCTRLCIVLYHYLHWLCFQQAKFLFTAVDPVHSLH